MPALTAQSAAPASGTREVRLAFAALVAAMLPAVLDQTVLATALPTIVGDLGRLADVSWVVTAYVIAATASTPLWGKLGDRHGAGATLKVSLAAFVLASVVCGLAPSLTALVLARLVQGLAAGGLMSLAMAAVGGLVAPRERGRYQGYIAAVFAGATALGPLLGGLLVEHAGWRWVFGVNLPVGAVALAGLAAFLPADPPPRERKPLDVLGAALLAGATCALLLVSIWGGDRYAWGSREIVGLLAAGAALAAGLVARERRAADPVVPVALLGTRVVAVASGALFLGTAALFAVVVFVPVYLQAAAGVSPLEAGLLLAPMMLGTTASTTLAGRRIERTGRYARLPVLGLALMTAALVLLGLIAPGRSVAATGLALVVFGLGFGLVSQVLVIAVQNAVARHELGTATAATGFFRALGGAAGAAALGIVFRASAGGDVVDGAQAVFLAGAPIALGGLLVALLLPALPLGTERKA